MCYYCLVNVYKGESLPMSPGMWRLAGLAWDWYQLRGNDTGGALHVVLDDMNVDDESLHWCGARPSVFPDLQGEIVSGLLELSEPERALVVHRADVYGSVRPAP